MSTHAAAVASIEEVRDTRGRFKPGCSGNPAGKAPGTLNRATILKRWMADGDDEDMGRQIIARAKQGEWAALRFVMERLDPKPRTRPVMLDFPEEAGFAQRCELVVRAMAAGEISPAEALQVARLLEKAETAKLAERATVAAPSPLPEPAAPPRAPRPKSRRAGLHSTSMSAGPAPTHAAPTRAAPTPAAPSGAPTGERMARLQAASKLADAAYAQVAGVPEQAARTMQAAMEALYSACNARP